MNVGKSTIVEINRQIVSQVKIQHKKHEYEEGSYKVQGMELECILINKTELIELLGLRAIQYTHRGNKLKCILNFN